MAKTLGEYVRASRFTNSNDIDILAPFIDLKTSTVDGLVRKVIEDYYQKNIFEGLQEFTGQILRVEEDRKKFQPSKLDSLGESINREIYKRYKVRVFNIDAKPVPRSFDLTPEDISLIDTYSDFTYIPYSFGNHEPMNVGDFVVVNFGNFKTKSDGRILFKFSGASHAQATMGSSEKKDVVSPKKVFEEKKPEVKEPAPEPAPPPPVKETPPPPPPPPNAEYVKKPDRTIQKIGAYATLTEPQFQDLVNNFWESKVTKVVNGVSKITTDYSTYKRNVENINNDANERTYPNGENPNPPSVKIDFQNLTQEQKTNYKRASYAFSEVGEDGIYLRAILDLISWHESGLDYGYDRFLEAEVHKEDYGYPKFRIQEFGKYPYRQNALTSRGYLKISPAGVRSEGSSAAGRYQFVFSSWDGYGLLDSDFKPESQDKAAFKWIVGGIKGNILQRLKSGTEKDFRDILLLNNLGPAWQSLPYTDTKTNILEYDDAGRKRKILYTEKIVKYAYQLLLEDQKRIKNGNEPIQTYGTLLKNTIELIFKETDIKTIDDLIKDGVKLINEGQEEFNKKFKYNDLIEEPTEEQKAIRETYTPKQKELFDDLLKKRQDLRQKDEAFEALKGTGTSQQIASARDEQIKAGKAALDANSKLKKEIDEERIRQQRAAPRPAPAARGQQPPAAEQRAAAGRALPAAGEGR